MSVILDAIAVAKENATWSPEDEELLNQVHDKASLVQMGDANFLQVEQYYGHKPEQGI